MKESIGYTVSLNIVITFIVIVFAFLSAALIYFKSNKVSNVITDTIEKYEGYNDVSKIEIQTKLSSLGYNRKPVDCGKYYNKLSKLLKPEYDSDLKNGNCRREDSLTDGSDGYCIFLCTEQDIEDGDIYYFYKVSTNLMFNVPIINNILDIPIFSNTNRLYDFEANLE